MSTTDTDQMLPVESNKNSLTKTHLFLIVNTVMMVSLVLFGYKMKGTVNDLQNELSMRPPVVIIDYTKIVQALPDNSSETTEKALFATKDTLEKFKDAGYVVLNAQSVATAPEDNYFPISLITESLK